MPGQPQECDLQHPWHLQLKMRPCFEQPGPAGKSLLFVPRSNTKSYRDKSFAVAAAKFWDELLSC